MIRNLKRTGNDDIDIFINSRRRVSNGLGEHGIIFASTSTLTFCHLRAASILIKLNSIQFNSLFALFILQIK